MQVNEYITNSLKLCYIEANSWEYDNDGNEVILAYDLSFLFHNHEYTICVFQDDLKDDTGPSGAEGESELYESFIELIEEEHWESVKEWCSKYDDFQKELTEN